MIIKLNVGGQLFITSKETITNKDSMLSVMVEHANPAQLVDGALFIDRDPEIFRWILNHLRGSEVLPRKNSPELFQLCEEASYFAIDGLALKIKHLMSPTFSSGEHVTVQKGDRHTKFTIVEIEEAGYLVTRGGNKFRINASENITKTSIEQGDVVMAYHVSYHRHMPGLVITVSGRESQIQFNEEELQTSCKITGVRF
jgi:hypothetical protein